MAQITAGKIAFSDGVKSPVEYAPPKKAEVEFTFSVGEGENHDAIVEQAMGLARSKVAELLGTTAVKVPAAKPPAPKPTPKSEPVTEAKPDPAAVEEPKQGIQTGGERNDPAAIGEDDALTSAPKEVTDVELTKAIGQKNAEVKPEGTPKIKALIAAYTPQDGKIHQAAEIPQAKRPAFLTELAKITKGG